MTSIHDDNSSSASHRKVRPKRVPTVRDAIASTALELSLPSKLFKRLAQKLPGAIVFHTASEQWADPIAGALDQIISPGALVFSETDLPRRNAANLNVEMASKRLSSGNLVIGVSHDPDRCLPGNLLIAAEVHSIKPLTGQGLVRILRTFAMGPIPRRTAFLKIDMLDFEEIAALVPAGSKAALIVSGIEAAIARKMDQTSDGKALPELEECIEFGAAREWALDLAQDIRDLRDGKIGWDACDRGAVLFGPPGTGKTMLARLLGKACGIPTIVASMADLFANSSGYLDGVIKAQRALFDRAKRAAPCILFLDELNGMPNADTVGSRNRDYWMPVILDFYTLLDSAVSDRQGVVVVGATNRIEDINPAILRPGRLERAIFVGPPDAVGVERILRHHLAGELSNEGLKDISLAAEAQEMTGAILMDAVRQARRRARREDRPLELGDLAAVVQPEVADDGENLWRVAVHEAGHAVIGAILAPDRLVRADVFAVGAAISGGVRFKKAASITTAETMENEVAILLAGRAAEEVVFGKPSAGAGGSDASDIAKATRLISDLHGLYGLGESLLWRGKFDPRVPLVRTDPALARLVDHDLMRIAASVKSQILEHRRALEIVAARLHAERGMSANEILGIIFPQARDREGIVNHRRTSANASSA